MSSLLNIQQQFLNQTPKMDASLSNSNNNGQQPLMKLPIPRLPQNAAAAVAAAASSSAHVSGNVSNKSHEMLITTSWQPANNNNTTNVSMANSLPVIPCQETIGQNSIGKPVPNKRGRKPLTTMPSTKKHIQNLTNQRAFRQRRENYIRTIESRASTLEYLYSQAQEEIKSLKEQLGSMRKQLFEGDSRNVCGSGALSNSPGLNDPSSMMDHSQQHCPHNNPTDACCGIGGFGGGLGGVVSASSSSSSSRQQQPMIYSSQQVVVSNNNGTGGGNGNGRTHMFTMVSSREGSPKDGMNCDLLMSDAAMSPISSDSSGVHSPPLIQNSSNNQSPNHIYQNSAAFQQQCLSPTSPTTNNTTNSPNTYATLTTLSNHNHRLAADQLSIQRRVRQCGFYPTHEKAQYQQMMEIYAIQSRPPRIIIQFLMAALRRQVHQFIIIRCHRLMSLKRTGN
ncbi:2290_t:CDS:2 [Ambispora gerdemannii]|uniref:2290_t:CDS:1 n=1 Tax=Ambispora gerdemannii TaxID=144530 RepID=A0A9N9BHS6_9GLOM|nr:2290_t:CDS:2 [Ambispora gerdemannii]